MEQLTEVAQSLNKFGGCENEKRIGCKIGEADKFAGRNEKWDESSSGFLLGCHHPRCSIPSTR